MKFHVFGIGDLDGIVEVLRGTEWAMDDANVRFLRLYLRTFRDDLFCIAEFPYVDSVYRDSYYEFFASKHSNYARDCVRVSLFDRRPDLDAMLLDGAMMESMQDAYLGHFVIRPTRVRNVGRSVVSPRALKNPGFVSCLAPYRSMIYGANLTVHAFPHSAQDNESMSCAETSLWTIMEYFSAKYQEYRPARPSSIRKALYSISNKRMVPSDGLTITQLSYALNQLGFGTMVYSRDVLEKKEPGLFKRLFHYYVESGIPVLVALTGDAYGHAIVAVGHGTERPPLADVVAHGRWMDTADLCSEYVVMDDNRPPFSLMEFSAPLNRLPSEARLDGALVSQFIVPLYPKIYLDAFQCRSLIQRLLKNIDLLGPEPTDPKLLRQFLTTARSFKAAVAQCRLPPGFKKVILRLEMPKFIWVAEEATRAEYEQGNGSGFLLLDATGDASDQSLLFLLRPGLVGVRARNGNWQKKKISADTTFRLYQNNLKGKWNDWRA